VKYVVHVYISTFRNICAVLYTAVYFTFSLL
jgi:hypothetical protein